MAEPCGVGAEAIFGLKINSLTLDPQSFHDRSSATQTATSTYSIMGGAGAYQNASGSGVIHVPPPSSPTGDTETWSGALLS